MFRSIKTYIILFLAIIFIATATKNSFAGKIVLINIGVFFNVKEKKINASIYNKLNELFSGRIVTFVDAKLSLSGAAKNLPKWILFHRCVGCGKIPYPLKNISEKRTWQFLIVEIPNSVQLQSIHFRNDDGTIIYKSTYYASYILVDAITGETRSRFNETKSFSGEVNNDSELSEAI